MQPRHRARQGRHRGVQRDRELERRHDLRGRMAPDQAHARSTSTGRFCSWKPCARSTRRPRAPDADRPAHAKLHRCDARVLVIDDSAMLLNFVKEILTRRELRRRRRRDRRGRLARRRRRNARSHPARLHFAGHERRRGAAAASRARAATARVPVVYMSGFGTDLPSDPNRSPNVVGSLNKPFTSELLLSTVETIHA